MTLTLFRVVVGVGLAILGFLLVADRLSLRALLAETGPAVAWHVALATRAAIDHSGAQAAELAAGLSGVALVVHSIRRLLRLMN